MSDLNPQLPKEAADLVVRLVMAAELGPNSFSFILFSDGSGVLFHPEISGYSFSRNTLDDLLDRGLLTVSSCPVGPYSTELLDDEDDASYTGRCRITEQGLRVGHLLSQRTQQGVTKLTVLSPPRQQVESSGPSSSDTSKLAAGAPELPRPDELIASTAKFLIEGGENEAASVILTCSVENLSVGETSYWSGHEVHKVDLWLRGPRAAYDVLSGSSTPIHDSVREAIRAVLPPDHWLEDFDIRAERMPIGPEWRAELRQMARGSTVNNQVATAEKFQLWEGLHFRSVTETRIAEALDRAGVLFFPLCRARLTGPNGRINREPDFLVCKDGRWGILEVDGEPYHPPSRTVQDHERDRLFRSYGIRLVEHFDANDCFVTPDAVVKRFLHLLDRAYP